jgi:glucose-1-phosphate cytidylyltransferase
MIPVVILCGGTGTRLKEMTEFTPKSLIEIGGIPMITHIMRIYAQYGFRSFVLALGYKQEKFKEYFTNFDIINNDVTVHIGGHKGVDYQHCQDWGWTVRLSDTGLNTLKGGRLKRIEKYIQEDTFMMTYGDAVADIDIQKLLEFHKQHGKMVTITGVHPVPRFGELYEKDGGWMYHEKPVNDGCWVNGGFAVMNRKVFEYLTPDAWCDWEVGPLELIAAKGELEMYKHEGYWQCMDTLKDLGDLERDWNEGKAKWRVKK